MKLSVKTQQKPEPDCLNPNRPRARTWLSKPKPVPNPTFWNPLHHYWYTNLKDEPFSQDFQAHLRLAHTGSLATTNLIIWVCQHHRYWPLPTFEMVEMAWDDSILIYPGFRDRVCGFPEYFSFSWDNPHPIDPMTFCCHFAFANYAIYCAVRAKMWPLKMKREPQN